MVKKGVFTPVDKDEPICRITAEISADLGRKTPPDVYTINEKFAARISLPFGMRWLFKPLAPKVMPKIYAALAGANTVVTTREALAKNLPEKELRFILAHEMSHLKTDTLSPKFFAGTMVKKASTILFWTTVAAGALSLAGVSLPVVLGGGSALKALGLLTGARLVGALGVNYASRVMERRADRNAMYLTRDYESGEEALLSLGEAKSPALVNIFESHPNSKPRFRSLKKAWEKACAYPNVKPGLPANCNSPREEVDPWTAAMRRAAKPHL